MILDINPSPTGLYDKEREQQKGTLEKWMTPLIFLAMVLLAYYFIFIRPGSNTVIAENLNDVYFNARNEMAIAKARQEKNAAAALAERRLYAAENAVAEYADVKRKSSPVRGGERIAMRGENFNVSDVKKAVAAVSTSITGMAPGSANKGKSKVVKVKSHKDGQFYFVADDLPDKQKAADKLAEINRRSQYLLQAIDEQLDGNKRIKAGDGTDITDNMRQLVKRHYKKFTPYAEYHNPSDLTVGSNSDKGMMIETCLRNKYNPSEWNEDNTLFRVHIHELAHSADFHYRADGEDGHGPEFKRLHQHLLKVAENLGIYDCGAYKSSGKRFCGLKLTEEYCGA